MTSVSSQPIVSTLNRVQRAINQQITAFIPFSEGLERPLLEAMGYSALNAGKRLRPFLVWATSQLFGVPEEEAFYVGGALELIHCYSLVHDDLPCMDNAQLRRGQPSCHVQFGQSTALLAGSALFDLAIELLASEKAHADPLIRLEMIKLVTKASGVKGMIGGQMMDMVGSEQSLTLQQLIEMNRRKTGMLFEAACSMGGLLGNADEAQSMALQEFGQQFGILFQITDDILDRTGTSEQIGKDTHQDMHKSTFVTLLGIEECTKQVHKLAQAAKKTLDIFGGEAQQLTSLVEYIAHRSS